MQGRKRIAVAVLVALATVAFAALVTGAGAAGNRATPKKPRGGAEFLEGKPATTVKFRWSLPDGHRAQRIQVSRGADVLGNGAFAKTVRSKKLSRDEKKIKLGIRSPGRYYWHVSSSGSGGAKEYGPASSFVVLATLSHNEAIGYTEAVIKDRLEGSYNLRKIDCDRLTKLAARCKFSGRAQGFSFSGSGKTFLKGQAPDNFKFYHYSYAVDFVNEACLDDSNGKKDKCSETIRWTA
jgi:hypothetical protein